MANEWAPEPLICAKQDDGSYFQVADKEGIVIFHSCSETRHSYFKFDIDTARRLATCYNACAGVPTERLEETVTLGVAKLAEIALSKQTLALLSDERDKEAPDDSGRTPAGD